VTKVLVVDDSPLMRRLLADILARAGGFTVELARNGAEALAALPRFRPDVVTLDVHMPGMDGLACLDRIMLELPCPVVMISSLTQEGAAETLEALALGAVDFVPKPGGAISLEIEALAPMLVEKIQAAARVRISRTRRLSERIRLRSGPTTPVRGAQAQALRRRRIAAGEGEFGLVLIGTSTGGPPALETVLQLLPDSLPWPVLIVQHMPASFTASLAKRLDRICALDVREVAGMTALEPGCAYLARGDADMIVSRRGAGPVALPVPASAEHHWHPSVDRLVASAMQTLAPERLIGVLMTGMGTDGAKAMTELRARGGWVIAESEETAVVWGMPGALVAAGGADTVVPLERIGGEIIAAFAP
jgi:two-component system chemotaxis response regulator CheB